MTSICINLTQISPNLFSASFKKDGEDLYLRMEKVTKENSAYWSRYKEISAWMANGTTGGILGYLARTVGTENYPPHEDAVECTGFTQDEWNEFTEKAKSVSKKTLAILEGNTPGTIASEYIVYITKNPDFSFQQQAEMTIKGFTEAFSNVLITMSLVNFQATDISRNPHWVFEQKYAGLSTLLLGFPAVVAKVFFPEKEFITIQPTDAMRAILKKNQLPDDSIKISALDRIFHEQIA